MRNFIDVGLLLGCAVAGFVQAAPADACELCCAQCGTNEAATKVCRLVCTEKKITVTCWTCESEEICLPGRHKADCQHWDVACEDPTDPCSKHHGLWQRYFVWSHWTPKGCGQIVTKKRLMKKNATKLVPTYKWIVEDLCPQCEANCPVVEVASDTIVPPAPAMEDAKIIGGKVAEPLK